MNLLLHLIESSTKSRRFAKVRSRFALRDTRKSATLLSECPADYPAASPGQRPSNENLNATGRPRIGAVLGARWSNIDE
jgi:hypothetical protein